jgi:hypothetical protein
MDTQDRQAIQGLFDNLARVERQSGSRDAEAENLIRSGIAQNPSAPYYMAQTIIVQEQALNQAQERLEQLQRQGAGRQGQGGLLSGLFGGSRPQQPQRQAPMAPQHQQQGPWGGAGRMGGGGFLAGAAQTAMGVAGGVLLGNLIGGMFASDEASADTGGDADAGAADETGADQGDTGADTGGDADLGGDFDTGDF